MSFRKIAQVQFLGVQHKGSWSKAASHSKSSSFYMDKDGAINVEAALDTVADAYRISRDPRDYLFIPLRANSADRPNNNLDGWELNELQRYDEIVGTSVYKTYDLKPHFVNHNAANLTLSRGVILDSHLNMQNPADDLVKQAVFDATGKEVEQDVFVELLVAMDTTKDPALAEAYRGGSVDSFSMGCDVVATQCSACDNIATNDFQLCSCVRGKHSRVPVECADGERRMAWEKCMGTVFQEISAVDDPADETATVQEGLLKVAGSAGFSREQRQEIVTFVVRHASMMPETVADVLNRALQV
jgi:hypothetical protein